MNAKVQWIRSNGDFANTRVATSRIDANNVKELKLAWKQPIVGIGPYGAFASTPLILEDGRVYMQDFASNVYAYDLATGTQKWFRMYSSTTIGPNGLAYEDGKVFGTTKTDVFALDAETGKELWKRAVVTKAGGFGFTIQPVVRDGVIYLSEAANPGGGHIMALNVSDGAEKWRFDTTDQPPDDNTSSGGAWNSPALDEDGNVYFTIGNGYYTHNSPKSTQNDRKYTNSLVRLDRASGTLKWHYQALKNDFWDWDLHLSPILTETGGRKVVVSSGKLGFVYLNDRETGDLIWKKSVGEHNGHDEDSVKQLDGTLVLPTPPFDVLPGPAGNANMALKDGVIYTAVVNMPGHIRSAADLGSTVFNYNTSEGKGELYALDLATGDIKWNTKLEQMPFGGMTISNDLVFTTTYDGKVRAYTISDGKEAWAGDLGAGANAPVAIAGDYLVTGAGWPMGAGQTPNFVAFELNAGAVKVGVDPGTLKFAPEQLTAQAGQVTFKFTNPDAIPHDFVIEKDGKVLGGTDLISKKTVTLTVTLEAGEYVFFCTPHRAAGMIGTLTVK